MQFFKVANVATCIGSAAVLYSQTVHSKDLVACHECRMKRLPKAKELPLYDCNRDQFAAEYAQESKLPLISHISTIRKQIFGYFAYLDVFRKDAVHIYETGLAHSKNTYDYLTDEENKVQRILIIASGGLIGYSIARKGGVLKRVLYLSAGTGLTFSMFYPALSKEYFSAGLEYAKLHANTALVKYGGYNAQELAVESSAKVEYFKNIMKLEMLTNKLNEWFYKNKERDSKILHNVETAGHKSEEQTDDKDMYTTRTTST